MRLGLTLSGGGIKGVAHIGVLKALSEYNIQPTHISATSAGALVGALYAAGHSWEVILDFFRHTQVFHPKRYALKKPGFIDSLKFQEDLSRFFTSDSFESLELPLSITATSVIEGKQHIFNTGELIRPLIASASFPGVFTPLEIAGIHYFDGGVIDDFPVELLVESSDLIIGSYVNPLREIKISDLKHSYQVLNRAYEINLHSKSVTKFKSCDLLFCPKDLAHYGTFSMRSIETIFNLGYEEACRQLSTFEFKKITSAFAKAKLKV